MKLMYAILLIRYCKRMKSVDISNKKANKGIIGTSRHKPVYDTASINRAIERAMKDEKFLSKALEILKR